MAFDPSVIINKEFSNAFRGYDSVEVDEFLEEIAQEYRKMSDELARAKKENTDLQEQVAMYQDMEDTMRSSLSSAQRTAKEVIKNARYEADLIRRQAQLQGDKEVSVALRESERQLLANRRKAEQVLKDANEEVAKLNEQAEEAKNRIDEYAARVRSMLADQMECLEKDRVYKTEHKKPIADETPTDDLYADLPYQDDEAAL